MEPLTLAAFVAAADTGSVSAGAARLGQTLSRVSRSIARLEAALGATLLERTGRGVRLTESGERLLERARHILREVELAQAEVRGAPRRDLTHLRLSAPPDLCAHLLPGPLAALTREYGALTVEVRGEARRVSLLEESYDAVVRLGPLAPSGLLARKLGTLSVLLCAAPGVVVARARELAGREVALVEGLPRALAVRERGRAVQVTLRGRVRLSGFLEAGELAARSDCLALLPSVVARPFLAQGRLRVLRHLRPGAPGGAVEMHLLRTPRHRGSALLERLATLLAQALAEVEAEVA